MKFTVEYIPLSKIKTDLSLKLTERIRRLRMFMLDCMHLLVVKKDKKNDSYTLLGGENQLEYLKKHTNQTYAPCIVDVEKRKSKLLAILRKDVEREDHPMIPSGWSIIRSFLKEEPRFRELSRMDQLKVLMIGVRYKKTVIETMKNTVHQLHRK
ncbi:hypothetical protein KO561_03180 [Radiobacillus kanasensis]|uniref:hypothetical protein n=1 Tax=Radiobacillus kanasensis TaxID=2844358 RepID=UPI001E644989|nr:hypothetical protein [Radiobacillus kanasensis]UFT99980.1 hypothetical protein KO561_03180 [Radiobacillus kanasensis]